MIIPSLLKKNDVAIIIAPSGKLPSQGIDTAIETLTHWGLKVDIGKHVYATKGVFAGSDAVRLGEFQQVLNSTSIKLILCARGGYGLTRYIDKLNFDAFAKLPKWVVGFSDVTTFHLAAQQKNIATIHGPMGTSFNIEEGSNSIGQLERLLFEGVSIMQTNRKQLKQGCSKGTLIGGNLSLICDSLGTATEINTKDKILVLEDVGDYYYRMDRMLTQLHRAGKLSNLKGLVIGSFNGLLQGKTLFNESIYEMITRLTISYDYPIAVSMPIGHEPLNAPVVLGAEYLLEVKEDMARLEIITKL